MAQLLPVDAFDLIIFGGTGDLAMRKLLPALYHRDRDGQFTSDSRIVATGRSEFGRDEYLQLVEESLRANLRDGDFDDDHWQIFKNRVHYVHADALAHDPERRSRILDSFVKVRPRAEHRCRSPNCDCRKS